MLLKIVSVIFKLLFIWPVKLISYVVDAILWVLHLRVVLTAVLIILMVAMASITEDYFIESSLASNSIIYYKYYIFPLLILFSLIFIFKTNARNDRALIGDQFTLVFMGTVYGFFASIFAQSSNDFSDPFIGGIVFDIIPVFINIFELMCFILSIYYLMKSIIFKYANVNFGSKKLSKEEVIDNGENDNENIINSVSQIETENLNDSQKEKKSEMFSETVVTEHPNQEITSITSNDEITGSVLKEHREDLDRETENKNNNTYLNENHNDFNVAVVATMSSGKSTTLNAMFGIPILPTKNEACTATVFKIEDIDKMKGVRARSICHKNNISDWESIEGKESIISKWNSTDFKQIEIQADLPKIDNLKKNIVFHDTPGPNNSMEKSHSEIAYSIFENKQLGYIVCVLNITNFGVEDEERLLRDLLSKLNDENFKAKIVFVVNKVDELDIEDGEDPSIMLEKVIEYLCYIGFEKPLVIPVMSLYSLEIRQLLEYMKKKYSFPAFLSKFRKIDHPFTSRRQRSFIDDMKYLLDSENHYSKAICSCTVKDKIYSELNLKVKGLKGSRQVELPNSTLTVDDLITVETLTGIPVLEKILEKELV